MPPWKKHLQAARLVSTEFGLAPCLLHNVDSEVIPEHIRWTLEGVAPVDSIPRKGSMPFSEKWLKVLLSSATGKRTPFGKLMSKTQVIALIQNIPTSPMEVETTQLDYHFSKDILIENEKLVVPTVSGYKFHAGKVLIDKRQVFVSIASEKAKKNIYETLSTGWNPPMVKPLVPAWFQDHTLKTSELQVWDKEVVTLLQMKSIFQITREHVYTHGLPQVVLPMFLVEEKDKWRPIIDARYSNTTLLPPWFSLPKIQNFTNLLSKNHFWFKCDVKGGWHHLPIHLEHGNFFAFHWKGKLFQYKVCPFGDATAPYAFTYLMITLKKMLRARGLSNFVLYIDDLLVPGCPSFSEAKELQNLVIKIQLSMGLVLGTKKCAPPSTEGEALGFWISSEEGIITFPEEKFRRILSMANAIQKTWGEGRKIHVKELASLLGKVVSGIFLCPHTLGFLHEPIKVLASATSNNQWDTYIVANPLTLKGISDWVLWCKNNPRRLWFNPKPTIYFSSDATPTCVSAIFWGVTPEFCPTLQPALPIFQARSFLTQEKDIASAEAFAISWGWKTLFGDVSKWITSQKRTWADFHICWATDNQVCKFSFSKGKSGHKETHTLAQNFLKENIIKHLILVEFVYIPSKVNFTADSITRVFSASAESRFSKVYFIPFIKFCKNRNLPVPTIDAMATKDNSLLELYASEFLDTGSLGNFFSCNFQQHTLWVFPPFDLIPEVLKSILDKKLSAWVLLPVWSTAAWWPLTQGAISIFHVNFTVQDGPILNNFRSLDVHIPWKLCIFLFRARELIPSKS